MTSLYSVEKLLTLYIIYDIIKVKGVIECNIKGLHGMYIQVGGVEK